MDVYVVQDDDCYYMPYAGISFDEACKVARNIGCDVQVYSYGQFNGRYMWIAPNKFNENGEWIRIVS